MKTIVSLIIALLVEVLFTCNANALTDAERQQAILQNTADLKSAVDAGDYAAATTALEALKKLKAAQAAAVAATEIDGGPAPKNVDDAFQALHDWGLSLSLAPDADEGKGAHFGFTNDRRSGMDPVWDAQFYLKWDLLKLAGGPVLDLGALRVDTLAVSAQGKITSTDNTSTDAWRFRFESESYLRINRSKEGILRGISINLGIKDESDRDFHMSRVSGELWLTPIASRIYIGRYSGRKDDWVRFRWRPYVGIDAGRTVTDTTPAGTQESNIWLMARGKIDLELNFIRDALRVKEVLLSAEDKLVYLTEQSTAHHYLKATFGIAFTESIGFALDYSVGKDSPAFQSERVLTGGLTVKF